MPMGDLQIWGTFYLSSVLLFVAQELPFYYQRCFSLLFHADAEVCIAGLPTLDNKHSFCSYLHLFQGKLRLG